MASPSSFPVVRPRGRTTAPGHSRLTTCVMSVLVVLWAVWAGVVLMSPIRSSTVGALLDAERRHAVTTWAVVTPSDAAGTRFAPALADPMSQSYETTTLPIGTGTMNGQDVTSVLQSSDEPQIAWTDGGGVHVTTDFETGDWTFPPGSTTPSGGSSPSAQAYRTLSTTHEASEARTIRDLWGLGSVRTGHFTAVTVFGAISVLSFVAGVGTLLARRPRFRTRWSWFWLFGCPLGVGFVWYVLREGWFGREPAPEERAGGGRGFVVFVLTSVVLGSIVHAVLFR